MFFERLALVCLLWKILNSNGERWYSATVSGSHETPISSSMSHMQDSDHRLMTLITMSPEKIQDADSKVSNSHIPDLPYRTTPEAFNYYNSPIRNVTKSGRIRPRRKIIKKRCPTFRSRIMKHFNQTLRSRFLEVFQVVEFKHVACTSSSGLEGTCLHEYECRTSGGSTMGTCADGYGTCCVTQFQCDGQSGARMGWFTNPDFPLPSTDRLSCSITLNKASEDIKQIRLDFITFELLPPTSGVCEQDQFVVSGQNVNIVIPILCGINTPLLLPPTSGVCEQDQFVVSGQNVNIVIPILCGINTGQHVVYIEVGDVDGPIRLSVQTDSSESRLFSIKITQLTRADELAAPVGCLQYYKDIQGFIESFNYRDVSEISQARIPSYLNNLNYAICIERAPKSCSVTYTNAGGMQIINYDTDGLPVIPPGQAGVEIFNCPSDWLLISATRLCGDRFNDGSVLQDFSLNAPITDTNAGPIIVWFRSDEGYVGRGFKLEYQQNACNTN